MGTRGAIGFRSNGVDKVTYNHYDSYPTGLGFDLMKELNKAKMCVKAMRRRFEQIEMWNGKCDFTEGGALLKYLETLKMDKSNNFMEDSLWCEWAYVVNLDDEVLEIYEGANKDKDALGRYASLQTKSNQESGRGYMGVALIAIIHLDDLYGANAGQIEAVCKYLESKEASFAKKDLQAMTARSEKIESFLVTPPCNT